jgi:hypothetical protein
MPVLPAEASSNRFTSGKFQLFSIVSSSRATLWQPRDYDAFNSRASLIQQHGGI